MLREPTLEDFAEITMHEAVDLLVAHCRTAEEIHTSQPFAFLFGMDTRLQKSLDHFANSLDSITRRLVDLTLQFYQSSSIDKEDLLQYFHAAHDQVLEKLTEDLEFRLAFLAKRPNEIELSKSSYKNALDRNVVLVKQLVIGIAFTPLSPQTPFRQANEHRPTADKRPSAQMAATPEGADAKRGEPPGIFLCHSHQDKAFVRKLARDLTASGARVWLDEAEMLVGDSLIEKIREGIDSMDYVAAVISRASVASVWVQRELDFAMNQEISGRRVKVLPLLVDDSPLPGFLVGKLYADFRRLEGYDAGLLQVRRRLRL